MNFSKKKSKEEKKGEIGNFVKFLLKHRIFQVLPLVSSVEQFAKTRCLFLLPIANFLPVVLSTKLRRIKEGEMLPCLIIEYFCFFFLFFFRIML